MLGLETRALWMERRLEINQPVHMAIGINKVIESCFFIFTSFFYLPLLISSSVSLSLLVTRFSTCLFLYLFVSFCLFLSLIASSCLFLSLLSLLVSSGLVLARHGSFYHSLSLLDTFWRFLVRLCSS